MRKHLFIALVLLNLKVIAQPIGPGGGGALYSPSISPHGDKKTVFVACDMSQVFRSTDFGGRWDIIHFKQLQGGHNARVQFTSNPNVLYSLDYSVVNLIDLVRPSRSTDGGTTWTPLTADPTGGGAITLSVDYSNPARMLISDYNSFYLSTDDGQTFSQKYSTNSGNGCHIAGVVWSGSVILVGTNQGLLISTNGGSSFSPANVPGIPATETLLSMCGAESRSQGRLYCITANTADVYAGITGGDHSIYKSIYSYDVGQTSWVQKANGIPSGAHPFLISMANTSPDIAYVAGGDGSAPIVYKTTNGGANWFSVFKTTNNENIITGWSGYQGDRDWSYGEYALGFDVALNDPNRVVITDLGFAHATSDGGQTWRQMYTAAVNQNPLNAPTPKGKGYYSNGLENTSCWHLLWDGNNVIGSYTDIRGARSTDSGSKWSFDYTGHTLNTMYHSVQHPQTKVIYAATSSVHDIYQSTYLTDARIDGGTGRVLSSSDHGKTWITVHDFGHPVIWLALDPNNTNRLYASVVHSTQGGIYVSNNINQGASSTWTKLASPPRTEGHPFNILVLNDGTLLSTYSARRANNAFTASSGVFVSTNAGTSWIDRSDNGQRYWTKDVVVDPHDTTQNRWYAGVWSGWGGAPNGLGGLYETTNRGVTWRRILNLDRVTSAAIRPPDGTSLAVTTEVDGVWYTLNRNVSTPTFQLYGWYPFRHPERIFFRDGMGGFGPDMFICSFGFGIFFVSPIPVELQSFTAMQTGAAVALRWTTASETNNHGFEIQRALVRTGREDEWHRIGYVEGNGTTTSKHDYEFIDRTVSYSGIVRYRLKQIDFDGTSTLSPVAEVNLSSPESFWLEQNYPNPFSSQTTIVVTIPRTQPDAVMHSELHEVKRVETSQTSKHQVSLTKITSPNSTTTQSQSRITLRVFDALGRRVQTLADGSIEAGRHEFIFDGSRLCAGVYTCVLQLGDRVESRMMLVAK